MKKVLLIISLLSIFILTSCNKKEVYKAETIYKNNKVVVNLKTYNKLKYGMTEDKVSSVLGGKCEKIDLQRDNPEDKNLSDYGCNGYGEKGANVILTFDENHKLYITAQYGLK